MRVIMMVAYDVEVGENQVPSKCKCCGEESCVGHGFVYKNHDAYAVYYVGWSSAHSPKKVSFALAVGDWGDDAANSSRTCFGVEATEDANEVLLRVLEPQESPWPDSDLLGEMLGRDQGLSHPLLKEIFAIVEQVLRTHPALAEYLSLESNWD